MTHKVAAESLRYPVGVFDGWSVYSSLCNPQLVKFIVDHEVIEIKFILHFY